MSKRCKRRKWSDDEKRTICAQTVAPGVSVAQVARRYDLNANQIFNWLKDPKFAPDAQTVEDPQTWLADTITRIPDYKITRVNDLLPWNASSMRYPYD